MWAGLLACLLVAADTPPQRAYEQARRQYFSLHDNKARQQYRQNWLTVIDAFERVAGDYPDSPEAPQATYTAAELWSDLHRISQRDADLEQALARYQQVAE